MQDIIVNIFIPLAWSFLVSLFAIPSIISVAYKKRLLDAPNDRTVHELLTPRLGGLAIFAAFVSSLTMFGDLNYGVQFLLAGSVIIFFIGLKDDIVSVSAFKKFLVQVLATGIVMIVADVRILSFYGILGVYDLNPGFSFGLTFVIIIGITNAVNLIDGLDGLAGSIVLLICVAFGIGFFISEIKEFNVYAIVAFSLAGALVGFLKYNFYKASIFMGDTGSLLCGFIVSVLSVKFVDINIINYGPALTIAILFIPLLDTIRIFILRLMNSKSPFAPDRNHIHHRLVDIGFNQVTTVLILVITNLCAIGIVWGLHHLGNLKLILLVTAYGVIYSLILEFAYQKNKKNIEDSNKI